MRMQDSLSPALDVKYSTSIDSVIPGSYHRLTYEQDHGQHLAGDQWKNVDCPVTRQKGILLSSQVNGNDLRGSRRHVYLQRSKMVGRRRNRQ
jgi:hypothetical protein